MTIEATYFGYWVDYHPDTETLHWKDTGEEVTVTPRPCPQCKCLPTKDGHDPCLGHIDGVVSACCGHGKQDGAILWRWADTPRNENGEYIDQ